MTDYWYPTAFSMWGDEERAAIERVVASSRFTQGEEVRAFERELAAYHGVAHAVVCNSGSSANLLMAYALAHLNIIKRGDVALVPALAWSTTYAPLVQVGLELLLVDCDATWNASPYELPDGTENASLVLGCSILGNPTYASAWKSFAGVCGATYVEDNCESIGAKLDGKLCGTAGLMNSLSFFWSHQLSAIEGGAVLTDDDECNRVLRSLRAHGWTRDLPGYFPTTLASEYDFQTFGFNVRGLEMHAALGRAQLRRLDLFAEARRANQAAFDELIRSDERVVLPMLAPGANPFGIHFLVEDSTKRELLAQRLRASGIDCRLPTGGSFRRHRYGAAWSDQQTPTADAIHDRGMFLGNAPFPIGDKIERAVQIMKEIL